MEKLSIKIRIADRDYPMKVAQQEEERLRIAGKLINKKIKHYQTQFGIDDKQDLLAMVVFDCFADKISYRKDIETINNTVGDKIDYLNQLIFQAI